MPDSLARRLALGFTGLTALTYGLVVLGALVRANGAGLACPDWPLCFGEVVPRFDLRVAFEWGHRALAGGISLLFVALSVVTLRNPTTRAAAGRLLAVTALVLAVQILLGALTVWHLLASWTVTSHLLCGNAFALCLALVSRRLFLVASPFAETATAPVPAGLRAAVSFAGVLLIVQVTLGGLVSSKYAGLACPDWPSCIGGQWFPSFEGALGAHLLHRLCGYALVGTLIGCAAAARRVKGVRGVLGAAGVLGVAQAGVGVANVLLRLPVEVTGLHSALAAALVLTVGLAVDESWRRA